jgi:hypothetical protein
MEFQKGTFENTLTHTSQPIVYLCRNTWPGMTSEKVKGDVSPLSATTSSLPTKLLQSSSRGSDSELHGEWD